MVLIVIAILLLLGNMMISCSGNTSKSEESTAQEEVSEEWITLFDGTSTEGWRGYNMDSLPPNWVIEEGTLKSLGTGGDVGGDIIYLSLIHI